MCRTARRTGRKRAIFYSLNLPFSAQIEQVEAALEIIPKEAERERTTEAQRAQRRRQEELEHQAFEAVLEERHVEVN